MKGTPENQRYFVSRQVVETIRFSEGFPEGVPRNRFGSNVMMKLRVLLWLSFLTALFMGSLGSLDEGYSLESCGWNDPKKVPGSAGVPSPPVPYSGCPESPVGFVGPRSVVFRILGAYCTNPQGVVSYFLSDSYSWKRGNPGCILYRSDSAGLKEFTVLRTVVLLI